MLMPVYGFMQGDSLGLLILAHDTDRVSHVIEVIRKSSAIRVQPSGNLKLRHGGRTLENHLTLKEAGVELLDRVDVVVEDL